MTLRRRPPPRARLGDGPPAPVGADRPRDRHRHRLGRPPDLARRGDAAGDPLGVLAVRDEPPRRDVGEDRDARHRRGGRRHDPAADARRTPRRSAPCRGSRRSSRSSSARRASPRGSARATRSSTARRPTVRTSGGSTCASAVSSPKRSSSRATPVAVLGPKLKRELFGAQNAIGRRVKVGGHRFLVIGVMAPVGQFVGFTLDDAVYVPVASAQQLFDQAHVMEIDATFTPGAPAGGGRRGGEAPPRAPATTARRTSPS